jgi:hypothetical protein
MTELEVKLTLDTETGKIGLKTSECMENDQNGRELIKKMLGEGFTLLGDKFLLLQNEGSELGIVTNITSGDNEVKGILKVETYLVEVLNTIQKNKIEIGKSMEFLEE